MRSRILAALIVALVPTLGVAPAGAQEYTTPTTPQYQTPDSGAGPDQGGETPDDDAAAPDDDAEAPDTGAGAPGDATRPLPARTLPVTGSEDAAFMTALGFVLLLGGFALRRGFRLAGPA